jgi:hypothetical protein
VTRGGAMQKMDVETAYRYVERRTELVCAYMPASVASEFTEFRRMLHAEFRKARFKNTRVLLQDDELLDAAARWYGTVDWKAVEETLQKEFGWSGPGNRTETVIRRVLKRGRIRGETEGRRVRDFVADQSNEDAIGKEDYAKLALLLDTWEAEPCSGDPKR